MSCCYQGEPVFIVDLFIYLNEKSNFKKKKRMPSHDLKLQRRAHKLLNRGASFETFLV